MGARRASVSTQGRHQSDRELGALGDNSISVGSSLVANVLGFVGNLNLL